MDIAYFYFFFYEMPLIFSHFNNELLAFTYCFVGILYIFWRWDFLSLVFLKYLFLTSCAVYLYSFMLSFTDWKFFILLYWIYESFSLWLEFYMPYLRKFSHPVFSCAAIKFLNFSQVNLNVYRQDLFLSVCVHVRERGRERSKVQQGSSFIYLL